MILLPALKKMSKEHPILFSTPMVQAILEGRKKMTRRVVKMPKENITDAKFGYTAFTPKGHISFRAKHANGEYGESFLKLKYEIGDKLWVRETFVEWEYGNRYSYKADGFIQRYEAWERDTPKSFHDVERVEKWKPSIFMPKSACRIFLEITDIKVERLQDISEGDAIKEGVYGTGQFYFSGVQSFKSLWQSINGEESWNSNPFVWAIEFKRIF